MTGPAAEITFTSPFGAPPSTACLCSTSTAESTKHSPTRCGTARSTSCESRREEPNDRPAREDPERDRDGACGAVHEGDAAVRHVRQLRPSAPRTPPGGGACN